jgi:hypothetical protein
MPACLPVSKTCIKMKKVHFLFSFLSGLYSHNVLDFKYFDLSMTEETISSHGIWPRSRSLLVDCKSSRVSTAQ